MLTRIRNRKCVMTQERQSAPSYPFSHTECIDIAATEAWELMTYAGVGFHPDVCDYITYYWRSIEHGRYTLVVGR